MNLLILCALSLILPCVYSRSCYAPDGSEASVDFQPCINVNGVEGMCCGTNRTTNIDSCQSNGLCFNAQAKTNFRDYCTDKTWSTPNCLSKDLCKGTASYRDDWFMKLTQCSDSTWCCGDTNMTDCCDKGLGFNLRNNLVTISSDPANSTVTVTASSVIATTTSTVTTTPAAQSDMVNKNILIGVAVALAVLIFVGIAAGFWVGRRIGMRGATIQQGGVPDYAVSHVTGWENKPALDQTYNRGPTAVNRVPAEMASTQVIPELEETRRS